MPSVDQQRADKLLDLARNRFDPLLRTIEEQVLTHSCRYKDPPDWVDPKLLLSPAIDTAQREIPSQRTPDRSPTGRPFPGCPLPEIRSDLIRWLLTDPEVTALLEPCGLSIWNARFTEPLDLSGCHIPTRLTLRYCLVEAPIHLDSTEIPTLSLRNSTLEQSLHAPFLKLNGSLLFEDTTIAGMVRFDGAAIGGETWLSDVTLTATEVALTMRGASISNDLYLTPKFHSDGRIDLVGLRLRGSISISGGMLATSETALQLGEAIIDGSVYLTNSFRSNGELDMNGAKIGGQLNCSGAGLHASHTALGLDGARVGGDVFLSDGFHSTGTIRMKGTDIKGVLSCIGAILTCRKQTLDLENATIGESLFLGTGFTSIGEVFALGTSVKGQLVCEDAEIHRFRSANAVIEGDFIWMSMRSPQNSSLKLLGLRVGAVRDDLASWPTQGNLSVNGLIARELRLHQSRSDEDRIQNAPLIELPFRAKDRIAWLNLQSERDRAEPQPWMHLASLLEAKGHKREARRVLYELRRHQSRANWKHHKLKPLGHLWDLAFARLEEQPLRILIPILLLATLSGTVFSHYRAHFAETNEAAYNATHALHQQSAAAYPKFQPFVYALENVLPVVKLGQDDKWAPHHGNEADDTSPGVYRSLVILRWTLILLGWAMGGILAAAVSARFRN